MADEKTTTGQEPTTPPADPVMAVTNPTPATGQEPGTEPKTFDADYVRGLRREAAGYRTRAEKAEGELKKHQDAGKSELEKAQTRLVELERQVTEYQRERQERTVRYEVMLAAQGLGIVDPEAAYRLIDLATIEFDDDGAPKNIEKVLKELLKAKPYLAKPTTTPPASINAGDGRGNTPPDAKARETEIRQRFRI